MRTKRFLAYVMTVFMLVAMLPSMTLASEGMNVLSGEVGMTGELRTGAKLSAKLDELIPETVTEEMVGFLWTRISEDDLQRLKAHPEQSSEVKFPELGKKKEYELVQEDEGFYMILIITGKEEYGLSGTLFRVSSEKVLPNQEEAAPEQMDEEVEEIPAPEQMDEEPEEMISLPEEEIQQIVEEAEEMEWDEVSKENESLSLDEVYEENQETVQEEMNSEQMPVSEEPTYEVTASTGNPEGILDFGEAVPEEHFQTFEVTNTGTAELHFGEISPEHFMVQDIVDPLAPGETITLWITPRAGLKAGVYEDVISYTAEEGVGIEITVKAVIAEEIEEMEEDLEAEISEEGIEAENLEEAEKPVPFSIPEEDPDDIEPGENPGTDPEGDDIPEPEEESPEDKFVITDCTEKINFGILSTGYTEEDCLPKNVEVSYHCEEDFEAYLHIRVTSENFLIENEPSAELPLAVGENQFSFTVNVEKELPAGSYAAEVQIFLNGEEEDDLIQAIPVTMQVAAPVYDMETDISELIFEEEEEGYDSPEQQIVLLFNTGNQPIMLFKEDSEYFVIDGVENTMVQPGESAEIFIQPKVGLTKGGYADELEISATSGIKVLLKASFQVKENSHPTLLEITAPANISGLVNGTPKNASALHLPEAVVIKTTKGNMNASVVWDLDGAAYNPDTTEAQHFTVDGQVQLPESVENTENISLDLSVNVAVLAYEGKIASPDENMIHGISGPYTTASRISFSAEGAGMDNAAPMKGDTRFLPESWSVVNSYAWEKAPYTASFGMAKAGNYKLSVVFKQQKYNGSVWEDTGVRDTKSVAFRVEQAAVSPTSVPGQTLSPAANKPAVNTGDDNPIALLIGLMGAAAAAVAGVFVYRSKKK